MQKAKGSRQRTEDKKIEDEKDKRQKAIDDEQRWTINEGGWTTAFG
jgi:hypothetical protein